MVLNFKKWLWILTNFYHVALFIASSSSSSSLFVFHTGAITTEAAAASVFPSSSRERKKKLLLQCTISYTERRRWITSDMRGIDTYGSTKTKPSTFDNTTDRPIAFIFTCMLQDYKIIADLQFPPACEGKTPFDSNQRTTKRRFGLLAGFGWWSFLFLFFSLSLFFLPPGLFLSPSSPKLPPSSLFFPPFATGLFTHAAHTRTVSRTKIYSRALRNTYLPMNYIFWQQKHEKKHEKGGGKL